ncbi:MAG: oxidoreductase [Parasporobacterium sp.]|nr:oxidoreductase [Parasporobacterium sp.]
MKKFHMIIDLEKCVGCFNCMLACKDEHVGNKWLPYTEEQQKHEDKWICPTMTERGEAPYTEVTYVTRLCQHCDNAPCAKKYPDVFVKRSDGVMLIDYRKAKNKDLVDACPYGMVSWNEELGCAQKCTGCSHLIDDGWKEPRCVQTCPLRALQTVYCEDNEWDKIVEKQGLKPITDGSNKPRVMYKNLYFYNKCFVKGALCFDQDGIEEAAIDAKVELLVGGICVAQTQSDFLGEFYIDRIPKNSGKMQIRATYGEFEPIIADFEIKTKSVVLDALKFGGGSGKPAVILPNEHANEQALTHMIPKDAEAARKAFADKK